MKKIFPFVLLTFVLLLLTACDRTPRLGPLPEDAVVLAFGDSITYGTGAAEGESYPEVLARLLEYQVVNAGLPGELSAQGVARLPGLLTEVQPDLVIILHGGNDVIQRRSAAELEANIRTMVALARDAGAQVLLIGVPQPSSLIFKSLPLYARVSWDINVPIDEYALTEVLRHDSLKSDEIHPNAEGYAKLAENIAKRVRKARR